MTFIWRMTMNRWQKNSLKHLYLLLGLLIPLTLMAHGKKTHESPKSESDLNKEIYLKINTSYLKEIKPILSNKCFDCHSNQTIYPWYYPIPGVKQLLDHDTSKAKEHIDMSDDFPFKGHHSVLEQLKAIHKVVKENRMPLWKYRFLHWDKWLTKEEKTKIKKWVSDSLEKFKW